MTILDKIADNRRGEIEQLQRTLPLDSFVDDLAALPASRFKTALSISERTNIIAEIKKGSPSKGMICPDLDPTDLANKYTVGGAAALSVLTEATHFFGSFENLRSARKATSLPILCKDFVVDDYQLYHARYVGAEAILLIVALHTPEELTRRLNLAQRVGLDCLVEVHDESELTKALDAGAEIVGVNNRDLKNFSVDLETSERLSALMPSETIRVSESGISSVDDIARLKQAKFNCFLIGEALATSDDPQSKLRELTSA